MAKPQYNSAHQKARLLALAAFHDGDKCFRCKRPMRYWQSLDLDHIIPVVNGGRDAYALSHSKCNRSHGGRLGNLRKRRPGLRKVGKHKRRLPRW